MTYVECDRCEGHSGFFDDRAEYVDCRACCGNGDEERGRTEKWFDPVRSIITHDGKYLCGDCVQSTKPSSRIVRIRSVRNRRTNSYSPVYSEVPRDDS